MIFGKRLKEIRIEKNISQKKAAHALEVSAATLSQYESGHRFPNEDTIIRLCNYYKISSDYLFGLTDVKHAPLSKSEAKKIALSSNKMDIICDLIDML